MKKVCLLLTIFILVQTIHAQKTGIQLYSFRNEFSKDVKGTVELIKSMGITEIEGGDTYGMERTAFKELLDANGLKTISVGADFNQLQKDPQEIIDNAKFFGASYVVCFWIPHNGNDFTPEDANKAITAFNTAGKLFKEAGLTFCYHPHGYEFRTYGESNLFDYMMQKTDARFVNFEMDVFWIKHPGQDPVDLLAKYPGRFKLMHLKDRQTGTKGNQNGEADVETNVVLGSGDAGIEAVMKAARKAGVAHYFIEDESSRSVTQVPLSLQYLASLP